MPSNPQILAPAVPLRLDPPTYRTCARILQLLLPYRRTTESGGDDSVAAFPGQLEQLAEFVAVGDPVVLTLPGFPCKSPNPSKVLGHLPDQGERLSLAFLDRLCRSIQQVYAPGARILICSDGHVFGDLIGVPDEHIDGYSDELSAMIERAGFRHLDTFDLRHVFGALSHDQKRARIHQEHAPSLEGLRAEVLENEDTLRLYRGITRFLVDDTTGFAGTRSALQRQSRRRAYGVIQRSRAWSDLIAIHHPRSVRLSIHPQRRGSAKFGIRLLEADDAWTTPWHSSVVRLPGGRWRLMRRAEAEKLGRLIMRDGRPSHFAATQAPANG